MRSLGNCRRATVFKKQTALIATFTAYNPSVASLHSRCFMIQPMLSVLTYMFSPLLASWPSYSGPKLAAHSLPSGCCLGHVRAGASTCMPSQPHCLLQSCPLQKAQLQDHLSHEVFTPPRSTLSPF